MLDFLKAGSKNDNGKEALNAMNDLMDTIISQAFSAARRQGINAPGKVLTLSNRLMIELKDLLDPDQQKPTEQSYAMTAAQLGRIEALLAVIDDRPFVLKGREFIFKEGKDKGNFADWLRQVVEAGERIKGNG